MLQEKRNLYKKAYVELYELIKVLPMRQYEKLPKEFIDYVCKQRDENYSFTIDRTKPLLEQDYMLETRALIVKMYEKYLAGEDEEVAWKKYNKICTNLIEKEKQAKYGTNDVWEN